MRERSIDAGLSFRFDRSPDYFALHRAHAESHVTWLLLRRGTIVGTASAAIHDAYVDGAPLTVAYLADLRQAPDREVAGAWRAAAPAVLAELKHEFGAAFAFCSILRDNRIGLASILRTRPGQPALRHLAGYRTVSVVGMLPRLRRRRNNVEIRRATREDSEGLRFFADACSRRLQFSPVFDRSTWTKRTEGWPDFDIGNFYISCDRQNRIVGCLAPWDAAPINRIVIDRLPPAADAIRRAANAAAFVAGRPPIETGPGSHLKTVALSHLLIADRNPEVLTELVRAAYADLRRAGRHSIVSLCLYDGDPLAAALKGTLRFSVPMDVYYLPLDAAAGALQTSGAWPGFEHYLV